MSLKPDQNLPGSRADNVTQDGSPKSLSSVPHTFVLAKEEDIPSFMPQTENGIEGELKLGHSRAHSHVFTPSQTGSPAPGVWSGAMPSTPKSLGSFQLSEDDSNNVEDLYIDEDLDTSQDQDISNESIQHQLIMPSLSLPDRRPFTDKGKNMGKLKILIAGSKSCGKSSFIKSIVQQCEDIVHVDFVRAKSPIYKDHGKPRSEISEVLASTKPYPHWWSDIEESRLSNRRKNLHDVVLDRNLSLIEFPSRSKEHLTQYIENLFWKIDFPEEHSDLEKLNLVSGNGSSLVDVILYVFSTSEKYDEEIQQFNHLSTLCNTIPVIGKIDLMEESEINLTKAKILRGISSVNKPFLFGKSCEELLENLTPDEEEFPNTSSYPPFPPFTISSLSGSDASEMDASLLMSSQYIQPLHNSELSQLLDKLLDPENIRWLNHSTARKYLTWRDSQLSLAITELSKSNTSKGLSPSHRARLQRLARNVAHHHDSKLLIYQPPTPTKITAFSGQSFSSQLSHQIYINAPILDQISKQDRARWLLERIHEEVISGTIGINNENNYLPPTNYGQLEPPYSTSFNRKSRRRLKQSPELPSWSRQNYERFTMDTKDPLGLSEAWEEWGKAIVWGAGGGLVVGVVWVVLSRSWANIKSD